MKKLTPVLCLFFGCFFICGCFGFNADLEKKETALSQSFTWGLDEIESVELEMRNRDAFEVNLSSSSSDDFSVEVHIVKNEKDGVTVSLDGKNLKVSRPNHKRSSRFYKDKWLGRIIIKCPKNKPLEDLRVFAGLGDLEIRGVSVDEFYLSGGVGNIKSSDMKIGSIELSCGVGNIELSNVVAEKAQIDAGVGNVKAKKCSLRDFTYNGGVGNLNFTGKLLGKSYLNIGVGSTKLKILDEKSNYNFDLSSGVGSVKINGEKLKYQQDSANAPNTISVQRGMGNVAIDFENP